MKKSWFTVSQVRKNIYAFAEFCHWEKVVSYIVLDKTQAYLIDTGMGYQSIKHEVEKITSLPTSVLLTHAHWDHIGSAAEFEDVNLFNDPFEVQSLQKGFSSNEILELSELNMFADGFTVKKYQVKGHKTFNTLSDQQIIKSDTFDIHVLHTPGHTPGSVCFYIPQIKILLTGDTLYPGPLYAQSPESNVKNYITSVKKLKKIADADVTILPGHNAVFAKFELLLEADQLFTALEKTNKNKWQEEVKGKLLSIKLK